MDRLQAIIECQKLVIESQRLDRCDRHREMATEQIRMLCQLLAETIRQSTTE